MEMGKFEFMYDSFMKETFFRSKLLTESPSRNPRMIIVQGLLISKITVTYAA